MPLIQLTLSGTENLSLAKELSAAISVLAATVLNKRPEVTVVTVSFTPSQYWFINSESLADLGKKSFHLSIRISDSTNLKNDKADYIAALHNTISKIVGDVHPVSYTAIDKMKADTYGYEGLTIEHKIIANKLNALKK